MEATPKKLLDQACTERGTPSRPEPSVLGHRTGPPSVLGPEDQGYGTVPEDQGPAEGLSKYLRVRFSRIRLFPRLCPNSSFAQMQSAPLSSPPPVPVGEECGAASWTLP
jgi:hypothetical protein